MSWNWHAIFWSRVVCGSSLFFFFFFLGSRWGKKNFAIYLLSQNNFTVYNITTFFFNKRKTTKNLIVQLKTKRKRPNIMTVKFKYYKDETISVSLGSRWVAGCADDASELRDVLQGNHRSVEMTDFLDFPAVEEQRSKSLLSQNYTFCLLLSLTATWFKRRVDRISTLFGVRQRIKIHAYAWVCFHAPPVVLI